MHRYVAIAQKVCRRLADLLETPVWVHDERGQVIAAWAPGAPERAPTAVPAAIDRAATVLPVRLAGRSAGVLIGPRPDEGPIPERLARAIVELAVSQTAVVEQLPGRHELKNKFIHDLLRGTDRAGVPTLPGGRRGVPRDPADLLREAQILGLDLTRPRTVLLIDAAEYILGPSQAAPRHADGLGTRRSWSRAEQVIASVVRFFRLPNDSICGYIGAGEVVVLKASTTQDLAAWTPRERLAEDQHSSWANLQALKRAGHALLEQLVRETGTPINIGVGRYHPGLSGLVSSYQDARAALSLGRRFSGDNRVHCLDELGVAFVALADERTKLDLATHLLSPLDHQPELLETLEAFFAENCCPSATAGRLIIHRNTLAYRLAKIAALTGLDPRRFDDAVQIRIALVLRALAAGDERGPQRAWSRVRAPERATGPRARRRPTWAARSSA